MIKIEDVEKEWMECELCGSTEGVVYIIFGMGRQDKRIKLCKEHKEELKYKI